MQMLKYGDRLRIPRFQEIGEYVACHRISDMMRIATIILAGCALAAQATRTLDTGTLHLLEVIPLKGDLHHVQGIDVQGEELWVTSVDAVSRKGFLSRFKLASGTVQKQVEVQDGDRFHPGGIALDGADIWLPVAEYNPGGPTTIQRRNKESLALLESFAVGDHIGCLAAGMDRLIGGNWDSRQFYTWDLRGRLLGKGENLTGNRYQDLKFTGRLLVGSGILSRDEGAIDWLDPVTFRLMKRITLGKTERSVLFNNEGMALGGGKLYLLPEDEPSRLFVFELPDRKLAP